MTIRTLSLFLAALLNLGLGSYLLWRYRRHRMVRILGVMVLLMAGYSWLTAGLAGAQDEQTARAWLRGFLAPAYLLTAAFFHFSVAFSRVQSAWIRRTVTGAYLYLGIWSLIRMAGLVPFELEMRPGQGWFPVDQAYMSVYIPAVLVLWPWGLGLIVRRRFKTTLRSEKAQIDFFFGTLLATILLAMGNLSPSLAFLGGFPPVLFTAGLAYGILRNHLLDISLVIRRGAIATAMAALVAAAFSGLLVFGESVWSGDALNSRLFAAFSTAFLLILFYEPAKRGVAFWVERVLKVESFDPNERLLDYSLMATSFNDFHEYLQAVAGRLGREMGLANVAVYVGTPKAAMKVEAAYFAGQESEALPELPKGDPLIQWTAKFPRGLDQEFLLSGYVQDDGTGEREVMADLGRRMQKMRVQAAFPLLRNGKIEGVLLGGEKLSGKLYKDEEYQFLSTLAAQIATVMQNSLLARQVEHADRLATLGTLSASVAHEIRNPLTAISNFVQMLPIRHQDEKFREKFSRIVSQEIEKLTSLTEQLLGFSRPAESRRRVVDLGDLGRRVVSLLRHQANKRGIAFDLDVQSDSVLVFADETQMSQILMNLALNAMQASESGGKVAVTIKQEDNGANARVVVRDWGSGMDDDTLARIFDPFYTTKTQGTGLGLATCQRLVEENRGKLVVKSKPGDGTTFEFVLPMADESQSAAA